MTTTQQSEQQPTERCNGRLGGEICNAIVIRRDGRLYNVATGSPHGCQSWARTRAGR